MLKAVAPMCPSYRRPSRLTDHLIWDLLQFLFYIYLLSQVADAYAQGKLGVGKATVVEPTGMEALKLQ